jgi:RNA polymerase sigma-70 factor (ECF subfamily)
LEDRELVERAQGGDAGAYGELVERHQARVWATLRKITSDADLAMDLTQDAFIRGWEKLGTFRGHSAFSTWLYRIAVRLAYDALERARRTTTADLDRELVDPAPDPERRAERLADAEELERRIAELPDVQRAVLVLRTWDEMPYREIASILGTTETSARVSYHYALTKLRQRYLEEATSE